VVIHITIPIVPKPQARDRIGVIAGKARSYKSPKQRLEENKLQYLLMAQRPPEPFKGAISLIVGIYLPIPKKSRIWQEKALKGEIRPTTRPDIDNYAKQILDTMQGIYFADDKQVVTMEIYKRYGNQPRWEIRLEGD